MQQYLTLSGHVYTPAYLLAGRARWTSLPARIRSILRETAREVQDFVYREAEALDERLLADLRAQGIEVNECDRDSFLEVGQPIFEQFAENVRGGGELIARSLALAAVEQQY